MPYPENGLRPYLSPHTVHFHRRKQERYVERTNVLVRESPLADLTLAEIVRTAERSVALEKDPSPWIEDVFDQASQAWNHALMWLCMAPANRRNPFPRWAKALEEDWKAAANTVFGSGWVWLTLTPDGRPMVQATPDAERPSGRPLAVMDVWEHAYYLDYPDQKSRYVDEWWDHLADWSVVEQILDGKEPAALR
jgi:Fe-Mn family superoxide dismutase